MSKWLLIESFYNGLSDNDRRRLDNACGGSFQNKGPNAAWDIIEEVATHSGQWDNHNRLGDRTMDQSGRGHIEGEPRGRGVLDLSQVKKDGDAIERKFEKLESKLESFVSKVDSLLNQGVQKSQDAQVKAVSSVCLICGSDLHETQDCSGAYVNREFLQEHVNQVGTVAPRNPRSDPYSFTYNPGWRNHPNFSHGGNQRVDNLQGGGNQSYGGAGTSQGYGGNIQAPNVPFNSQQAPPGFNNQGTTSFGAARPTYGAPSQAQAQEPNK